VAARLSLAALVVLVAAALSPVGSAAPKCTDAVARSAIRTTKPRLAPFGPPQVFQASSAGQLLCFDATGDGATDMAVSLFSGGTAGDVGWVFFAAKPDGWRLAGSSTGYKLLLRRAGTKLEVVQPVYRKNDPNCCPTGGFDHTLFGWNGKRLVAGRTWHTKSAG
jgi:hypothetical protein